MADDPDALAEELLERCLALTMELHPAIEHLAQPGRRSEPDLKERMATAIAGLPEGYRTVFLMHDVEGFTHEEIGTALGVQSGTSKAQLFRARARLREALADFAGEWTA